jgi:hypothetical protein
MGKGLVTAALSVALSACTVHQAALPPPPEEPAIVVDEPVCISCSFLVDGPELARLLHLAEAGDPNSAYLVYRHYVAAEDNEKGAFWLRRAAELGDVVAQYSLWYELRSAPNCVDRLEALSWLERSAAQGSEPAKSHLGEFQNETVDCKSIVSP